MTRMIPSAVCRPRFWAIMSLLTGAAGLWLLSPEWSTGELRRGETLIPVQSGTEHGVINTDGRVVIPPGWYEEIRLDRLEQDDVVLTRDDAGRWTIRDRQLKAIARMPDRRVGAVTLSFGADGTILIGDLGGTRAFNRFGKEIGSWPLTIVRPFDDHGMAVGRSLMTARRPAAYLVEFDGGLISLAKWNKITPFNREGLACVGQRLGISDFRFGCIDRTGEIRIQPFSSTELQFDEYGWSNCCVDGKHGWIDRRGSVVLACEWDDCRPFGPSPTEDPMDDVALVKRNDQWGGIDRRGNIVIPFQFETVGRWNDEGLAITTERVGKETRYKWFNCRGEIVLAPPWEIEQVGSSWFSPDGYCTFKRDGMQGIGHRDGRVVVEPTWNKIWPIHGQKGWSHLPAFLAESKTSTHLLNDAGNPMLTFEQRFERFGLWDGGRIYATSIVEPRHGAMKWLHKLAVSMKRRLLWPLRNTFGPMLGAFGPQSDSMLYDEQGHCLWSARTRGHQVFAGLVLCIVSVCCGGTALILRRRDVKNRLTQATHVVIE
jgi:hypothetical protein